MRLDLDEDVKKTSKKYFFPSESFESIKSEKRIEER